MRDKSYLFRICLTKLFGSREVELENSDGIVEEGVFIPFEPNGMKIEKASKHVYISAFAVPIYGAPKEDSPTHRLRLKVDNKTLDKLRNLGYETPIIGSIWKNKFKNKTTGEWQRK